MVAVTGVASAAAFSVPPMSLPGMPGSSAALRATASRATVRSASLSLEMARVPFIAGNWKMNPTSVEEVPLVSPFLLLALSGKIPCHFSAAEPVL